MSPRFVRFAAGGAFAVAFSSPAFALSEAAQLLMLDLTVDAIYVGGVVLAACFSMAFFKLFRRAI